MSGKQVGPDEDSVKQLKSTYLQLLDETLELTVSQPIESVRKIIGAGLDNQSDVFKAVASNVTSFPVRDIFQTNQKLLQAYTKQVQQGKEITSKTLSLFTETTIAWQKVAAEAGRISIDAYGVWLKASGL